MLNMGQRRVKQVQISQTIRFKKLCVTLDGSQGGFQFMGHIVVEFLFAVQKLQDTVAVFLDFDELIFHGVEHQTVISGKLSKFILTTGE